MKVNIHSIVYVLYILFISNFFSCKKENVWDCVKPAGKNVSENRTLSPFHTIIVEDKVDVYLKQDQWSVLVKAGKNLIRNITTEVKAETLYIRNNNKCNFIRDPQKKVEAYIYLPKLKYLKHTGSGNIYAINTFVQDTMIVRIESPGDVHLAVQTTYFGGSTHGNGDLYISGRTKYFYYNYNGTNYIYARDLQVQNYVYLESYSVGHAYVNLNNIGMDAALFTNGNIYYYGQASFLNYTYKGKGRVIRQD